MKLGYKTSINRLLMVPNILGRGYIARILKFLDYPHTTEQIYIPTQTGNFVSKRNDFLFLPDIFSAKKHFYIETVSLIAFSIISLAVVIFGLAAIFSTSPLTIAVGLISIFYVTIMVFKLSLVHKSKDALVTISKEELDAINENELPTYTIIIPLLHEAEVMEQIINSMTSIDYPKDKLEIIVTLEEYDHETIEALRRFNHTDYIRPLILPNTQPKTKPKALNVALLEAKGELLVIYDAEIIPDRDQLKKAVITFKKKPEVDFIQTRLDHYNANRNLITKLFNAEFSFHYDLFLPGLARLGLPCLLSGHSVHFKKSVIEKVGGWDPYNVTEDCDIGIRLHRAGHKACILDSISKEEATPTIKAWVHQRTRWTKGFIQTSIVHLRHPTRLIHELGGWKSFISFILTIPGGMVLINVINIIAWILFTAWFTTRSTAIQDLYPLPVLYLSSVAFFVGMFIFTYLNLVGSYQRDRFSIVKYSLLSPLYWILQAYATCRAIYQFFVSPYSWEKTTHGTHLILEED